MKIGLDINKNRRKMIYSLTLVLLQYLVAFVLLSESFTNEASATEYLIYFSCIMFVASFGLLQFYHHIRLKKHKNCVIAYENGILNDQSAWIGKIHNLKVEDMESISRWSGRKKNNEYKIVMGKGYQEKNKMKKLVKRKSLYLKDTVVNTEELLKLAELIGNDIAKRKATKV